VVESPCLRTFCCPRGGGELNRETSHVLYQRWGLYRIGKLAN
jgi:hypothetical protein